MSVEGDLVNVDLAKVMLAIGARDKSGILTVQGEDDIVAVSFLGGGIVSADALNQTVEEGLGEVLRGKGLISAEDFSAIASEHQGGNAGSLAELLVNRGMVTRAELLEGLRTQTYRLLLQILPWQKGEFKFYGGDEVSFEEGFDPISVPEFLVRAARETDDQSDSEDHLGSGSIFRRAREGPDFRVIGRDGEGFEDGVWLTPSQETLLRRLDGRTELSALAEAQELSPFESRYAVRVFLENNLIEQTAARPMPDGLAANLSLDEPVAEEAASLQAEIFLPPEPADQEDEDDFLEEYGLDEIAAEGSRDSLEKTAKAVSLGLTVALILCGVWLIGLIPSRMLFPFQWNDPQMERFELQRQRAHFMRIDRGAKVYFLLKGHYPDHLGELVEAGLLASTDVVDEGSQELEYSSDDVSYQLGFPGHQSSGSELKATEGIAGDFLLDPQFVRVSSYQAIPLVLLD